MTPGFLRPFRALLSIVLILTMCRIGEARVPGPDAPWKLGICNPSGLQGKHHILSSIDANVVAISETHLTKAARRNLALSLRSTGSKFKQVLTGAPLAPRADSSDAGLWSGVAMVSEYPCRSLAVDWPPDVYETARVQFSAFFAPTGWISGAVLYGYPEGRKHPHAHAKTEGLLDFAFDRLTLQPGPKFMAGDWNFSLDSLAVSRRLLDAGWIEAQDLWYARTGQSVRNTCKGATRKDFLWISPELALRFLDLTLDSETFADHAVLVASFAGGSEHLERFVWPCPKPVPWTSVAPLAHPVDFAAPLDPTAQYAKLWQLKESTAKQELQSDWMPNMAGRAAQLKPKRIVGSQAPLKHGRAGDVQPGFFGFSALHAKQFKQVRRLQNYCRWVDQRPRTGVVDCLHGIGLWNSILRAPGFGSSFTDWWLTRHFVSTADPATMPQFCPGPEFARQIFDAVLAEVRLFEQRLLRAQIAHRTARHEHDRHLVFREVARDPPEPVETLIHRVDAVVNAVDAHECAVELDRPVALVPHETLWIAGQAHEVIHAEADKVWIDDVTAIQPSDKLVQTKYVGDLRAVFEAFHEQWQLRWCKHDAVPFTHWSELVDFAKHVIRPCPVQHLVVDGPLIQAEGSRKKKRAATGLDGVSRTDIVTADPTTLSSIANLYARAETDGEWPTQLVAGKVHSLAKTADASAVGDYRPITIFGLPYRIWSSIQSRHLLQFAEDWVDDSVFGNRKGRQAADLWNFLLHEIETAYATSTALTGISADLVKCFNCIPRFPALCLAVLVGTPDPVTIAWSGALAQMCRHFKVRESYSDGFLTSTGLAEGCGLSVFGMLLVDHLFACWMRVQSPQIRCLTYVDDWQTLTSDPSVAVRQLELVEKFAGLLDLTVDKRKTFAWATCPELRLTLRAAGITVLHHARELGGHLGISKQYTNRTLTQRIAELDSFWSKLRSSKARLPAKVFMLRAVAWPRGLHAVSSAPVGNQVWLTLRRQALKSLGWQRPGVNPAVFLGLVERDVDPQLVALQWTFRDLTVHSPADFCATTVAPLAHGDLDLPPNSPAVILLHRLLSLGWSVDSSGLVHDRFGAFCLQACNRSEVKLRLTWAWNSLVAQKVAHRSDFEGLANVDLGATRKALHSLAPDDQAMYRLSLSGGLFTERYKAKWTDQPDQCRWCGASDTLKHRYWECPQHQDLRESLAPDATAVLDFLPAALALRGWALLPPTWPVWTQLLLDLPADVPLPWCTFPSAPIVDVFTDGSCLCQSDPLLRCAAWSVTVVPPFQADWQPGRVHVLCASFLPGLCQSAYRAELYAVAYALHRAADSQTSVRVWTDCLGVILKFNWLVRGQHKVNPNRSNADLWTWVVQSVDRIGRHQVSLHKVPAHRALHSATTKKEAWLFFHNDLADKAARQANQTRPPEFWKIWERHAQEAIRAGNLYQQVKDLHIAVGRRQVQVTSTADPVPEPIRPTREFAVHFDLGTWQGEMPPGVGRLFGVEIVRKAISWFFARIVVDGDTPPLWISFHQLYIDFQLTWGHPGPLKVQRQWVDVDARPYIAAEDHSCRVRVRWFRQLLKALWKAAGVTIAMEQCRPHSGLLQAYLPSASVKWDARALQETEAWLSSTLTKPCTRDAKVLASLPLAVQSERMRLA